MSECGGDDYVMVVEVNLILNQTIEFWLWWIQKFKYINKNITVL